MTAHNAREYRQARERQHGLPSTASGAAALETSGNSQSQEGHQGLTRMNSERVRQIILEERRKELERRLRDVGVSPHSDSTPILAGRPRRMQALDRCKKLINESPPWLQAGNGFATACLAGAALGIQYQALEQQKLDNFAAKMSARAATATAMRLGALKLDGATVVTERNNPNSFALQSAAYSTLAQTNLLLSRDLQSCLQHWGKGQPPDSQYLDRCRYKLNSIAGSLGIDDPQHADAPAAPSQASRRLSEAIAHGQVGVPVPEKSQDGPRGRKALE